MPTLMVSVSFECYNALNAQAGGSPKKAEELARTILESAMRPQVEIPETVTVPEVVKQDPPPLQEARMKTRLQQGSPVVGVSFLFDWPDELVGRVIRGSTRHRDLGESLGLLVPFRHPDSLIIDLLDLHGAKELDVQPAWLEVTFSPGLQEKEAELLVKQALLSVFENLQFIN